MFFVIPPGVEHSTWDGAVHLPVLTELREQILSSRNGKLTPFNKEWQRFQSSQINKR